MLKHLVVELEWLLIDELVIESFAVCWLDDVALGVHAVLVALLSWLLVLTLELLLLLHCVIVMLHKAFGRGHLKFVDATVIELINCFVEGLTIDTFALVS